MTSTSSQAPGHGRAEASRRYTLAALLMLATPLATVIIPRIATTLLVAAVVFVVITRWSRLRRIAADTWAVLRRPLAAASLALFLWAALSSLWAVNPAASAIYALRAVLVLACAIFVAAATLHDPEERTTFADFAFYGICAAAIAAIVISPFHEQIGAFIGRPVKEYHLNRGAVTLSLLLPAALLLNWHKGSRACLLFLSCTFGIFLSTSESAKIALVSGTVMFVLAQWRPKLALALFVLIAAAVTLLLPFWLGPGLRLSASSLPDLLSAGHAAHRLQIWQQFLLLTGERPIFGWGMESSRFLFSGDVWQLPGELQVLEDSSVHPHNAFLQMWFEMGVAGALLSLALLGAGAAAMWRMPSAQMPFALALGVMFIAVSCVSHGAWQNWWVALSALSVIILARASRAAPADPALP